MKRKWRCFCEKSSGLFAFVLPRWVRPGRCPPAAGCQHSSAYNGYRSAQMGPARQIMGTAQHTRVQTTTQTSLVGDHRTSGAQPVRGAPPPTQGTDFFILLAECLNRPWLDNHKAPAGGCFPLMRSPRVSAFTFLCSPPYPHRQRAGAAISIHLPPPPALGCFRGESVTELPLQILALKGLPSPSQLKQRAVSDVVVLGREPGNEQAPVHKQVRCTNSGGQRARTSQTQQCSVRTRQKPP